MKNIKRKFITLIAGLFLLTGCEIVIPGFNDSSSNTTSTDTGSGDTSNDISTSDDDTSSSSIEDVPATKITLSTKTASVAKGESLQLTYSLLPQNATSTVSWKCSNSYCSVDQTGLVTGIKPGRSTITATTDNNLSATCSVTITKPSVTGITISPTSKTIDVGESFVISTTISPEDARETSITWKSSNTSVASVSSGTVTGIGSGNAVITAKTEDGGFEATCNVTVTYVPTTGITLSPKTLEIEAHKSATLTATISPSNASNKNIVWTSNNTSIATVTNGTIHAQAVGIATITAKTADGGYTDICSVTVTEAVVEKQKLNYLYKDVDENSIYGDNVDHCPKSGNPKLLIVPVWFTDSSNYIQTDKKSTVKEDIEKTYFGTESETGWNSVSSYYTTESGGRCNLTGVVTDWWECGYSASQINTSGKTAQLVEEAVDWYFSLSGSDSRSSFDTDRNGYLDGVMLIYGAPDSQVLSSMPDNMWAYCFYVQDDSLKNTSKPGPNVFFWASYDFMYGDSSLTNYYNGDTSHCTIDAHTFIHEMGHVFGLEDYYDYNNQYLPAAGFSMQDYNVGGHDPFSVMAYGWADPYVPTESCTIEIEPFVTSHDLIVLSPDFTMKSAFDEYIILELYTPTGLNKFDSDYKYSGVYPQGPSVAGIRVWHVDARLYAYYRDTITNDPNTGYVEILQSNTSYKSGSSENSRCSVLASEDSRYYDYNLLQMIRNNTSTTYHPTDKLSSSNMFKTGDTFSMSKYKNQFVNSGKLNSEINLGFTVNFTSVTSTKATIEIVKA